MMPKWNVTRTTFLVLITIAALSGTLAEDDTAKINVRKLKLTFEEDFNTLNVSAWGPGTRWIAHTPWNGDFGDAAFSDPRPGFPFTVNDGILRIEARKDADGKWKSGLLASTDPNGNGFSQQYGYFEMRAKLPKGPGLWPAFWLNSIAVKGSDASVEVDVLEHYGHFADSFHSVVHTWFTTGAHTATSHVHHFRPGTLYQNFYTYGVLVRPDTMTFYMDRVKIWQTKTPPEHQRPLGILLNLALGSGWPIDQTPNPSYMYVDYVRVFAE